MTAEAAVAQRKRIDVGENSLGRAAGAHVRRRLLISGHTVIQIDLYLLREAEVSRCRAREGIYSRKQDCGCHAGGEKGSESKANPRPERFPYAQAPHENDCRKALVKGMRDYT